MAETNHVKAFAHVVGAHVKAFADVAVYWNVRPSQSERRQAVSLVAEPREAVFYWQNRVRQSLLRGLRGDSDAVAGAGNAVRPRSLKISLVLQHLRAPCKPHNK